MKTLARATDPITSIEAAEKALNFLNDQEIKVMKGMRAIKVGTAKDIARNIGCLNDVQVNRRLAKLRETYGLVQHVYMDGELVRREGCALYKLVE